MVLIFCHVEMVIWMGRIRGIFDLDHGVPAAVFQLEFAVCRPINGLITGLGEEMVAERQECTC